MKDIRTLSLDQLKDYFSTIGDKPFRAKQVYDWLWSKNLHSFDEMTNLPKNLRDNLSRDFFINPIAVDLLQKSSDGTIKNGVKTIETKTIDKKQYYNITNVDTLKWFRRLGGS